MRGVNWLGDAVMTTPALLRLREAMPGARISLLTSAKLESLWLGHPAVDEVLTFAATERPWSIGRRLREGGFEAALILPNSPRSALECLLGRIPVRVGYPRSWRGWLLTHRIPERPGVVRMRKLSVAEVRARVGSPPGPAGQAARVSFPAEAHHCHEYLTLASVFGASPQALPPALFLSDAECAAARAKFGLVGPGLWLGLNPGAEYGPAKRWPIERFSAAAREVTRATGGRWILFGGGNDRSLAASLAAGLPGSLDLSGRTSLRELMAVLSACSVLLTNDTGPMHVAAALGVPVVVPFGSTSPELTGPGLPGDPRHRWVRVGAPCAPCFLRECPIDFRCMQGIGPERVAAEVLSLLGGRVQPQP